MLEPSRTVVVLDVGLLWPLPPPFRFLGEVYVSYVLGIVISSEVVFVVVGNGEMPLVSTARFENGYPIRFENETNYFVVESAICPVVSLRRRASVLEICTFESNQSTHSKNLVLF